METEGGAIGQAQEIGVADHAETAGADQDPVVLTTRHDLGNLHLLPRRCHMFSESSFNPFSIMDVGGPAGHSHQRIEGIL